MATHPELRHFKDGILPESQWMSTLISMACKHFNIPKVYSMFHYVASIRSLGTVLNTEGSERLHIIYAERGYHASNKNDYIPLLRTAYIQWHAKCYIPSDETDWDVSDSVPRAGHTYIIAKSFVYPNTRHMAPLSSYPPSTCYALFAISC
jgi:hypothetical protein